MATRAKWRSEAAEPEPGLLAAETQLEFYARRAMEEARAARTAATPQAASAHMYLAAAYAEALSRETRAAEELERLALRIA